MLQNDNIRPLTEFVNHIRSEFDGRDEDIPYFDPLDGGIHARCLFLLEAPGPGAVCSGFVSRDNPDDTAKNFLELNEEVLGRGVTVSWNIVPWYLGSGGNIRTAMAEDLQRGEECLKQLLSSNILENLKIIVLVGGKAQRAEKFIVKGWPHLKCFPMHHPSPQFINRAKEKNRQKIRGVLEKVAEILERE